MRAIILAGGKGTRLLPYTTIFPKPLMPLGEKPILGIIVRQLCYFGFTDITLAIGYLAELLMAYFGDGKQYGVHITYSREEQPLGTAGPLSLIQPPETPFLVMNGDVLTTLDYKAMREHHIASGAMATVGTYFRKVKVNLGTVQVDENGRVVDYIEKPQYEYLASIGIYIFSPTVMEYIPANQYLDLPDLIRMLVLDGHEVRIYKDVDYWLDIGRLDDYEIAQADFERMRHILLPSESNQSGSR